MESTPRTRTEHDSMGTIEVPIDALYGAQTARAVQNFPISGQPVPAGIIHALAQLKAAAAAVNGDLGVITAEQAKAIETAAKEVVAGTYDEHFPIDVFQTGSGTSTNMNVNEVISHLTDKAGVTAHPNDHVNAGQSSNDTFPSAIRVAASVAVAKDLDPALETLEKSLAAKAEELKDVVKTGRTHLMDAVPVTLGQEFASYARQISLGRARIAESVAYVHELPLGGTATGTGLNAKPGFAAAVIAKVAEETGVPFTEAADHFEAQGTQDAVVALSGALRTLAVSLTKICNDLRWMGSGPLTGLAEIRLPDLQPGSSIMPGKVNPVLPEATLQVCAQVIGNDAIIATSGASGNFELNVMLPVAGKALLEQITFLAGASATLATRCIDGIEADAERCKFFAEASPSIVTSLNSLIGYEAAAAVAKQAVKEGKTIRETVIARGHVEKGELTEQQLDEALDVLSMARPNG
ncbi:class II fumarate hydratase [Dermacoccaceae bacterium W4C1]